MFKTKAVGAFCIALLWALNVSAQAPNCGDANGDGNVDVADFAYTVEYFFNGGPPPLDFDTTDQDRRTFLSIQDLTWMLRCPFICDIPGDCSPIAPPISPSLDTRVEFNYETPITPETTSFGIRFGLSGLDLTHECFLAPLNIMVDGAPAVIDSIVFDTSLPFGFSDIRGPGSAIIALTGLSPTSWNVSALGKVYVTTQTSMVPVQVEMMWDTLSPSQAPVSQLNSQYPLFITTDFSVGNQGDYVPALVGKCCWTPGDTDHNGSVNIADVTYDINRIFGSVPAPPCCEEADASGDGSFNIGDVTTLISFIFDAGPPPVCGPPGTVCGSGID